MVNMIDWKGKIGYGDIISPICYAHNQADRLKKSITLNFYFEHSIGTKFKQSDAETINQRVEYITKNISPSIYGVEVNQIYDTKIDYNHTNYTDYPLSYHNLRFSKNEWNGKSNHVAVVSSVKNKKQFSQYARGKVWKDPLAENWEKYIDNLSKKYSVELVDYETPIKDADEIISSSRIVIGYHGSAMWLARWLGAPMIVYSSRELSKKVFPWCVHNPTDIDIDKYSSQSINLLNNHKNELERYVKDLHWPR
jgi:hypothetical protein